MFDFPDFLTLVNKALIAEREYKLLHDNKLAANDHKCKFEPKKDMQPLVENRALVRPEKSINPGCITNRD